MISERLERRVSVRANSYDPATRSFEVGISTSAGIERCDYGGAYIETLDPSQTWPSSVPLLDSHDFEGANVILGRLVSIRTDGGELIANIKLSSRAAAQALGRDIQGGLIDGVVISYMVTKWHPEMVDGRRRKTAEKWKLCEVSLPPIPGEQGATRERPPQVRRGDIRAIAEANLCSDDDGKALMASWIIEALGSANRAQAVTPQQ